MKAVYYFLLHFLADFILQPRAMGRNKSTHYGYLLGHIYIIFFVFLFGTFDIKFSLANALVHLVIDAFIWKGYMLSVWKRRKNKSLTKSELKKTWMFWEDHWFYVTIGLDQFLHGATILILLDIL